MADMLSFISNIIKETDGLSMRQLVQQSGMTRSMFYRFMQEPTRFSNEQLERISSVLGLDQTEKEQLLRYRSGESVSEEYQEADDAVRSFIFNNWPTNYDDRSKVYTLYDARFESTNVVKLSAYELITMFQKCVETSNNNSVQPLLQIKIINCCDQNRARLIYSLLRLVRDIDQFQKYRIEVIQAINATNMGIAERIKALSALNNFFATSNYQIDFADMHNSIWQNVDCCTIEYTIETDTKLFAFAILPSPSEVNILLQDNPTAIDFLTFEHEKIFKYANKKFFLSNDPISINRFFAESSLKYRRLYLLSGIGYDSFAPDLWDEAKESLKRVPEIASAFRRFSDPLEVWSEYSDAQYFNILFDTFKQRYLAGEQSSSINVIHPEGINYFVSHNANVEFESVFRLSDQQVLKELKSIRERLGEQQNKKTQSYYILEPTVPMNYYYLVAYRDYSILYCSAFDYENASLMENGIQQPEIATMVYDYVINTLLPAERRKAINSPIMSDEKAEAYIDSLIAEVEHRIAE